MINLRSMLYLLSLPLGFMGLVQCFFAVLSYFVFADNQAFGFLFSGASVLVLATIMNRAVHAVRLDRINYRDALLFATLTWISCGMVDALPFMLLMHMSLADAFFESVSALTTTGATTMSGLDSLPKSFLLYRQFLQWLGGLGVVVFVVAVLPMLNVGGMKLLKAETPGPVKDEKLSPRIASTAHYLWAVYISLTALCALSYRLCGMTSFDAISHSFTTVSTGGFSTHDASMGFFESPLILVVSDIFMLLGAISFALHFRVWSNKSLVLYWRNEETRVFLLLVFSLSLLFGVILFRHHTYDSFLLALNMATFHLISFITSTGYGAADFPHWPMSLLLLLIISGYFGGCSGSTAGGNKIIRNILSFKIILLEMGKLVHANHAQRVKYQQARVEPSVLSATMAFMTVAALSSMVLTLMVMATGVDVWSAFSAVASCLNVSGPAFGVLSSNFEPLNDTATCILSFSMILGRLEYFTVIGIFLPAFWRF